MRHTASQTVDHSNSDIGHRSTLGNTTITMFNPNVKVKLPLDWPINATCKSCGQVLVPEENNGVCSDCE